MNLVLRPVTEDDAPELLRLHRTEEVACRWNDPRPGFPFDGAEEPGTTRLTIVVDDVVAGLVEFHEELDPDYRHASIDVFLGPDHQDRGIGTEVVRRVVAHLTEERGHHRVTIDPAAANHRAIRAYEKAGFRRVGVLRAYERDRDGRGWHDGLLMELVVDRPSARA